jgi:competence ComEA-like helix-hairpin-helix protein
MKQSLSRASQLRSTVPQKPGTNKTPWCGLIRVFSWIAFLLLSFVCSCAKLPRHSPAAEHQQPAAIAETDGTNAARVNINTAPAAELEKLPGIGNVLAGRIIAHREQYGPFRRAEQLMVVQGISDHKFRAIRWMVTVE